MIKILLALVQTGLRIDAIVLGKSQMGVGKVEELQRIFPFNKCKL